jgi:hypothetical protein
MEYQIGARISREKAWKKTYFTSEELKGVKYDDATAKWEDLIKQELANQIAEHIIQNYKDIPFSIKSEEFGEDLSYITKISLKTE